MTELRSAFSLVLKDFKQYAVDVSFPKDLTIYHMETPCPVHSVILGGYRPQTFATLTQESFQGLSAQSEPMALNATIAALESEPITLAAHVAEAAACTWEELPLYSEPTFSEINLPLHSVTFEAMKIRDAHAWEIPEFEKKALSSRALELKKLSAATRPRNIAITKARHFAAAPRFYQLPFKKSPLPLHRFSPAIKTIFREALAEKGKTRKVNVLLKAVYPPLTMEIFEAIETDPRGNLLCTPKQECLGKQGKRPKHTGSSYLVMGNRLDNQEPIKALVPLEDVETAQQGEGA